MNYPWLYPSGPAAFWNNFPFQFDDPEAVHLRHAFLDDIIIGGNDFGIGAALEHSRPFDQNMEDNSALKIELSVARRLICAVLSRTRQGRANWQQLCP